MGTNELFAALQQVQPLSDPLRTYLTDHLQRKVLARRELLLKTGHYSQQVGFVVRGTLRSFYVSHDKEITFQFMLPGDAVLAVPAFFDRVPSEHSIQALDACELLCLSKADVEQASTLFPEVNRLVLLLLQRHAIFLAEQEKGLRLPSGKLRYAWLQERFPEWVQAIPAKFLASYLGITEVYLSEIKSGWV